MTTKTDVWPFGNDADRDDPLTAHRVAVTSSHPGWSFLVSFDRQSEARPTDAETAMLASYLDEYKHHWYGDNRYRQRMEQRALDVDGGANGVILHKFGEGDWGYRRRSYRSGFLFTVVWPNLRGDSEYADHGWLGPLSLLELMDRIHTISDDKPMQRWIDWKSAHPEVFGAGR
ncbi:hypothetical protein K1W54_04915 [Micromonospora sp. CPCC 205371]|nr:hypothetical protein [Micromonospora sp. CPCC 205371]